MIVFHEPLRIADHYVRVEPDRSDPGYVEVWQAEACKLSHNARTLYTLMAVGHLYGANYLVVHPGMSGDGQAALSELLDRGFVVRFHGHHLTACVHMMEVLRR